MLEILQDELEESVRLPISLRKNKSIIMLKNPEYEALNSRLEQQLHVNIRTKRIRAIKVNSSFHWQPPLSIEVDGWCGMLEKDTPPERIIAIFEHASFIVVTPDRGFIENSLPYFFTRQDVQKVIEY
jgi:hypothetical protein